MAGIAASLVRMLESVTRRTTGEIPVRGVPAAPAQHIARSNRKPRPPVRGSVAWHEMKATEAWNRAEIALAEGDIFLAGLLFDCWRFNVETVQTRRAQFGPVTIPL